nr:ABC transporter permease [Eubacterium sp.]
MEIWTLLKANIRYKKGAFFAIATMMFIIALAVTSIISSGDNCKRSVQQEFEQLDNGELCAFLKEENYTEDLEQSLKEHKYVEEVTTYPSIVTKMIRTGTYETKTSWFMQKLRSEYHLYAEDETAETREVPELKEGEIYVPLGVCTNAGCHIGDTIEITVGEEVHNFTIKGIIVEPYNGCSQIGFKQVFISDSDFDKLYKKEVAFSVVYVKKKDSCSLSDGKFKRELNLACGITDQAEGSLAREASIHYTCLFPDMISSILMVFMGMLFVVVLIVMGHNISSGIEMEYTKIGVLKSQGFTQGKIRGIYILQYILAEGIGIFLGMVGAIPLTRVLDNVFEPITATSIQSEISILKCSVMMLATLVFSVLFIVLCTRKIKAISPVKALNGGHEEIYFDSRLKAPIGRTALSLGLAFRQLITNKRQYVGILGIAALLTFFVIAITGLGNVVSSESALESMGVICSDVDLTFSGEAEDVDRLQKEVESTVEEITGISEKYYLVSQYISLNGEEIYCMGYQDIRSIKGILEGRAPLYENEIMITETVAESFDLHIGDEVQLGCKEKKESYLISGYNQSLNDVGMCVTMSLAAAKRIGILEARMGNYCLTDATKKEEVAKAINEKYEGEVSATAIDMEDFMGTILVALQAMKAIIYIFTAVFVFVVVYMVCSRSFLREKTDIGIYKSLGFTSNNLRMMFAMRFLLIALLGSGIGMGFSILCSEKLLTLLLKGIGVTNLQMEFGPVVIALPIAMLCTLFFLFAYVVSRKVRKVSVRELVAET